jgi:hypothetical protein
MLQGCGTVEIYSNTTLMTWIDTLFVKELISPEIVMAYVFVIAKFAVTVTTPEVLPTVIVGSKLMAGTTLTKLY